VRKRIMCIQVAAATGASCFAREINCAKKKHGTIVQALVQAGAGRGTIKRKRPPVKTGPLPE
jgi:hypothetical protein